ncbi:NADPH-dependent 7-cyano-7-deazaguanine reductase QueF [Pandoraea sputorum]|uniref:NADPH-dependent 7-cyano-7-deazaguanine reductase QueF n=1 Tax=Pandoraea sputorum TaxID=93222 RepID=UPI001240F379|nr:NADPH-dependent 7-cyano-7-deazaguanine reductase QueF [Pandoraea sputorum]
MVVSRTSGASHEMTYRNLQALSHRTTLHPIPRSRLQYRPPASTNVPRGYDLWNHYEISWMDMHERPQIAVVELVIPCDSPYTLEMADAQRYFLALRECRFESPEALESHIASELSRSLQAYVLVRSTPVRQAVRTTAACGPVARSLDTEPVGVIRGGVDAHLLRIHRDATTLPASPARECLTSDLLSVRCPLSGGVDYGTVWFDYTGLPICSRSLMAYVLSFRDSEMYIEQCVETLFADILTQCTPSRLSVRARFTRRYGLDINPVRSTHGVAITNQRTVRQ